MIRLERGAKVRITSLSGVQDAEVVEDRDDEVKVRCNGRLIVVDRDRIMGAPPLRFATETVPKRDPIVIDPSPRARPRPKMSPPARSEHFKAFVREWPCCACTAPSPSDPHHYGSRGMGQKTDDYRCVPLCRRCHDIFHDTRALPSMDVATTKLFFLQRQVDILVAYMKHIDSERREPRTE